MFSQVEHVVDTLIFNHILGLSTIS